MSIAFTVPGLIPPSVNHYKVPILVGSRRFGQHISYAETPEAKVFKQAVWHCAYIAKVRDVLIPKTQKEMDAIRYELRATVVLGAKQRGDGDNFWKCLADALVEARVIHSDARVRRWIMEVEDQDRENPRTEIQASVIWPQ